MLRKITLASLFAALAAPPAAAQVPADVPDRLRLSIGGIFTDVNTTAGVGTESGAIGTYLDFEEAFNLPVHDEQFIFDASWRVGGKHHLDFGFFELERAAARVIEQDIDFGDYTFQAGAEVTASWGSQFPYAAYRFNFLRDDRVHISGSAGVSYLTLDAGLAAEANVTGPEGPVAGAVEEEASVEFPVPLFGLQVDWGFARRWMLDMYLRNIRIDVDEFDGGMKMSGIRVEWWPWHNFGFAGGYETVELDVREFQSDDLTGRFNYSIPGVTFYLKGAL
jgi:hypothetical protein